MALPLDTILRSGGGDLVYILHIGGLDWAAVSDNRIITALNLNTPFPATPTQAETNAINMRKSLFGYNTSDPMCNYVKVIKNLDDNLGSQTTDFDDKKGLAMSSWNASFFGGMHGYTWDWQSSLQCFGVMGLDVMPSLKSPGVVSGILADDYVPRKSASDWVDNLYWYQDTDEGLRDYINARRPGNDVVLWFGNSCGYVGSEEVNTSGDKYFVSIYNQAFNTPNESVFRDNINGLETIRITNVPQRIKGNTVKLFCVHWDDDMEQQCQVQLTGTGTAPSSLQTPILLRSGKAQSGVSEQNNTWSVSVGGWVEQLKAPVVSGKASAALKGFSFNRYDPPSGEVFNEQGVYQSPHMSIRIEGLDSGGANGVIEEYDVWLDDSGSTLAAGDFLYFDTIDELRDSAFTAIQNDCTTTLIQFSIDSSGDLVYDKIGATTYDYYSVTFRGPVAFVLGWGFIAAEIEDEMIKQSKSNIPKWCMDRGCINAPETVGTATAVEVITWEPAYDNITNGGDQINVFNRWVTHIRYVNSDKIIRSEWYSDISAGLYGIQYPAASGKYWAYDFSELEIVKCPTKCKYFYQNDYNALNVTFNFDAYFKIPQNAAKTNRQLNLTFDSDVALFESGQTLSFGKPGELRHYTGQITGVSGTTGGAQHLELDYYYEPTLLISDSIGKLEGPPWGATLWVHLFWCQDIEDEDPHPISDSGKPVTDKPSSIFKTMLGDRSSDAIDQIGERRRITTITDLFGADDNSERELVDWDKFDELAEASEVEVAYYSLNINDEELDETVYDLMWAVCISLGIRICYEYQESQRARVLTFRPFGTESIAEMSAQGKFVNERDLAYGQYPGGIVGGEWLYSAIKPEIYDEDGAQVPIKVQQKNGDNNAPIYEYKDLVTVLKKQESASDIPQEFLNKLYRYATTWGQENWTQKLSCNIGPYSVLSVGSGCLYSGSFLLDRFTGQRGVTERPGDLVSMTETLSRSGAKLELDVQIDADSRKGWAPSVDVDANDCSYTPATKTITIAAGGFVTSASANTYQDPSLQLVDQAYFGCWSYNKGLGAIEKLNCGCGNYQIVIAEGNTSTLDDTGASRNVWHGTFTQPTAARLSNGSGKIILDDDTNFSTKLAAIQAASGYFEIDFDDSDHANMQSCQLLKYGFLGDSNGKIDLSGGSEERSIEWK